MPTYDTIQQAAFVPGPNLDAFLISCHTLAFPASWRSPILDLYTHGKSAGQQAKIKQVPIKRLNAALRTIAPDLVTVDAYASFDDDKPWIYSDARFPVPPLTGLVHAWLRDMQPKPEIYPLVRETARQLDLRSLAWTNQEFDLLAHTTSPGGTRLPDERLYRLLPETLAARITQLDPYEYCGERVSFMRVAVDARANGAELMSWPPREYATKKYGTWHYSAVIRVALKTVPFSPTPRIHVSTGVRRWVKGDVFIPRKSGASTYLLSQAPLTGDVPPPTRFAVATLQYDSSAGRVDWRQGGPEGLLTQISAIAGLPSPDVFAKEPETWLPGRDGITAAVAHHTRMGWHAVGAGLMPSERRRLTEWVAQAFQPEFVLAPELQRSGIKQANPKPALKTRQPVGKKATDHEIEEISRANVAIDKENSRKRRALTASALDGAQLTVFLLYQTDAMRDHLVAAAESSLALDDYRTVTGPDLWAWETPDLTVHLHARPLDHLGSPLGGPKAPRRGTQLDEEIRIRRLQVANHLTALADDVSEIAQLTIVELDGRDKFAKRTTDPKFAIRLGCADAGMVSQFIRPRDPDITDEDDDSIHRAAAAWGDGLRQAGVRFVPAHTLGAQIIPESLNQLAFWMVKRRSSDQTRRKQFTPIAVLIRPNENRIVAKMAGMTQWIPYPELLVNLTGIVSADEMKTADEQSAHAATFIQNTLYSLKSEPTLVVTHAQNTRYRWPWLQNGDIEADRIQFGAGPMQRLALHGKKLRIARVATSDRDETAQWWAPNITGAGISKGLWVIGETDDTNRIYYSTSAKASTHSISVDATKLTSRLTPAGKPEIKPNVNAWNPELLEFTMAGLQPGDDPEQWAMYLHQQRFTDDYRDGLGLPLIMHLAELSSDYALPHDGEVDELVADDEDEPDASVDSSVVA